MWHSNYLATTLVTSKLLLHKIKVELKALRLLVIAVSDLWNAVLCNVTTLLIWFISCVVALDLIMWLMMFP